MFTSIFLKTHGKLASMDSTEALKTEKNTDVTGSLHTRIANHGRALTAKELAGILNVSPVTIFKQAKKGTIPSFRVGTCVRFEPKKTAEWLVKQ
jgi:excisionase family DNA binding protein